MWADAPPLTFHRLQQPVSSGTVTAHSASAAPSTHFALTGHGPPPHTACFCPARLRRPQPGATTVQGDSALRCAGKNKVADCVPVEEFPWSEWDDFQAAFVDLNGLKSIDKDEWIEAYEHDDGLHNVNRFIKDGWVEKKVALYQ
ncbi:hypothetical protein NDU88_001789 [Pleurodeles waltl]|uniref:Uncharacterized protein n=1 Tax=Pleurodeles waltl TaxID=8319 RepID=A0AAV7Q820_PLEWA|nr:hypothetical protein NDU88_001789 [Pleurodeles waltl]